MFFFLQIVILFACLIGLWKGADIVVISASRIAQKLGLSDLVIGLTVVALATSAPEFAVTVSAALAEKSDISVGNIVGSNIFNLFFILGILSLFGVVKTNRKLVYRDGAVLIGTTFLLLVFLYDNVMSFLEGLVFLTGLVSYIIYLIINKEKPEEEIPEKAPYKWYYIFEFMLGMIIIVLSGHYFVSSASEVARLIGVSEWAIGVTIVAAGTSAPEMATSLVALLKGKYGMSAGNLVGSDIFNMLGVLGTASVIRPLTINETAYSSIVILSLAVVLVVIFFRTGWRISRLEGAILLIIVAIRWYFDFMS